MTYLITAYVCVVLLTWGVTSVSRMDHDEPAPYGLALIPGVNVFVLFIVIFHVEEYGLRRDLPDLLPKFRKGGDA